MGEPLIELKRVSKAFGDNIILDRLDLVVHQGEGLVVIGPSGTGKSTVLRILAGLMAPDKGEIYIKGKLRQGLLEDGEDLLKTSLVFQQTALFDSLTVEENVGFFLYEHSRLPASKIRELVRTKVRDGGVTGISRQYPSELSGNAKRVSFARAIMSDPDDPEGNSELVLYDEPTAGLDPIASTVIENLVRHLHGCTGGCNTYVMVSHQESTIRRTADRVIFLYHGKVQWQGSVREIDTTDHTMVRQFLAGV